MLTTRRTRAETHDEADVQAIIEGVCKQFESTIEVAERKMSQSIVESLDLRMRRARKYLNN